MAEKTSIDVDPGLPPPYPDTGAYPATGESTLPSTYSTSSGPPPGRTRTYSQTPMKLVVDRTFLISLDSILLITEAALSLIAFICAASDRWFSLDGGGWIIFVGLVTFTCQVILFIMYLFRYIYSMPSNVPVPLVELIYYAIATLFFFISAIVAATKWHWSPAVQACTVFCWFAFVTYSVDTYRRFIHWRNQNQPAGPSTVSSSLDNTAPPSITTEPTY